MTDPIEEFVEAESRAGSWPGGAWIVEEGGRTLSAGAAGLRAVEPAPLSAEPGTIYDLASLTKPLASAALLVLLEQDGRGCLDEPARSYIPDLACAGGDGPTVKDLLLHRSGLPAWRPFYAVAGTPDAVLNSVVRLEPEYPCGTRVVYSDPGYILLGEVIRKLAGRRIDELFRERIAARIGLETLGFLPPASVRGRIAPTEKGNRHEERMAAQFVRPLDRSRFRRSLIQGEVHDGNAHALGGAAGHAGLFGTAADVARLAREFIGAGVGLFGAAALAGFRENLTPGLGEGRTLGWKRAVAGAREAEGVLPEGAFGHAGFTGTSVWIDPKAGRSYVLLTNRVHPEVRPIDMTLLRRRFHEIGRGIS